MVSVEKAKELIISATAVLKETDRVSLYESSGRRLVENVFSPLDLPPFNQSAVDGYGIIRQKKRGKYLTRNVTAEIKAGDHPHKNISAGEAVRIFTGAEVPSSINSIIMQEEVEVTGTSIRILNDSIKPFGNIRKKGEQIRAGNLAMEKNSVISAAAAGFLASLGLTQINVYKKPRIGLIITGNELQERGKKLKPGKIYESNSVMLETAIRACGFIPFSVQFAKDERRELEKIIRQMINTTDIVLLTGGVSVGKYDLVKESLENCGVVTLFHKVAQKPGKPLYFGKNDHSIVFGLPGNPAAALVCFYEYVLPALKKMSGEQELFLPVIKLPVIKNINKKSGISLFARATVNHYSACPVDGQESYMLRSFSESDALIYLPAGTAGIKAGETADVHLLPSNR